MIKVNYVLCKNIFCSFISVSLLCFLCLVQWAYLSKAFPTIIVLTVTCKLNQQIINLSFSFGILHGSWHPNIKMMKDEYIFSSLLLFYWVTEYIFCNTIYSNFNTLFFKCNMRTFMCVFLFEFKDDISPRCIWIIVTCLMDSDGEVKASWSDIMNHDIIFTQLALSI